MKPALLQRRKILRVANTLIFSLWVCFKLYWNSCYFSKTLPSLVLDRFSASLLIKAYGQKRGRNATKHCLFGIAFLTQRKGGVNKLKIVVPKKISRTINMNNFPRKLGGCLFYYLVLFFKPLQVQKSRFVKVASWKIV